MDLWSANLALAGSPAQWTAVVLMGVLIFAPQILPRLARWVRRVAAGDSRQAHERGTAHRRAAHRAAEPEVLPPERPGPTFRASDPTPLAERAPRIRPRLAGRVAPSWWVPAVVCAAIGVILWLLLRQR